MVVLCFCSICGLSQVDTTSNNSSEIISSGSAIESSDSLVRPTQRNPKRAALMSTLVPGLGQAYNKRYWKLPIVYGALGLSGFFVLSNRAQFQHLKNAYIKDINTTDGDVSEFHDLGYQLADIQREAEAYQTQMEYAGIAFVAFYLMQVVDAAVDAHLYYFDVSEDLTLRWEPSIQPTAFNAPTTSLSLTLQF